MIKPFQLLQEIRLYLESKVLMNITYEEAVKTIPRAVTAILRVTNMKQLGSRDIPETEEPMVVYRALGGEG